MIQVQPVYLHREFAPIVQAVSNKLLHQLKAYDDFITGVHYLFGHPLEIINTLKGYSQGGDKRFDKYPLVAFFLDTTEDKSGIPGIYAEYSIHMAIIRSCNDPTQTADERDQQNFIPVLTPIYMELINQIGYRGDIFQIDNIESIPHRKTNRYYWGRSGLWGNEANIFDDWVDCIEIQNLKLKVFTNYCPKQVV